MDSSNDAIRTMRTFQTNLAKFHSGLLAKVLIQRAPGTGRELSSVMDAYKPERSDWARFLDDLSLLCDFRNGGKTVKSIAVRDQQGTNVFWMASNVYSSKDMKLAEDHLKAMLIDLYKLIRDGTSSSEAMKKIYETSINLAGEKVKNYKNRLSAQLERLVEQHADQQERVSLLAHSIRRRVLKDGANDASICYRAFSFPTSVTFQELAKLAQQSGAAAETVHYLGRLGSWMKATRSVVSRAHLFRHILSRCEVSMLPVEDQQTGEINTDGDIEDIICRAISAYPPQKTLQILKQKSSKLLSSLQGQKQKPKVHAEAALLYHFRTNGFQFAEGEEYIGCSKPSCYACAHYFDILGAPARQRHGNAWLQWCPPGNRMEAAEITEIMAERVTEDVKRQIEKNILGWKTKFDSTTGITGRPAGLRL